MKTNCQLVESNRIEFDRQNETVALTNPNSSSKAERVAELPPKVHSPRQGDRLPKEHRLQKKGICQISSVKVRLSNRKADCHITINRIKRLIVESPVESSISMMPNHPNKKSSKPKPTGGPNKNDGIKAVMRYSKQPKLNENENKIKVTCIDADGDSVTEYLPTYEDGDPRRNSS